MHLLANVPVTDLAAGDTVLLETDGLTHTSVVHEVKAPKQGAVTVTFLRGERVKLPREMTVPVVKAIEHEDVELDVEDPRDRPDLAEAQEARNRMFVAEGMGMDEKDLWRVYHDKNWRAGEALQPVGAHSSLVADALSMSEDEVAALPEAVASFVRTVRRSA